MTCAALPREYDRFMHRWRLVKPSTKTSFTVPSNLTDRTWSALICCTAEMTTKREKARSALTTKVNEEAEGAAYRERKQHMDSLNDEILSAQNVQK